MLLVDQGFVGLHSYKSLQVHVNLTTALNTSEVGHTAIPERVRILGPCRRGQSRWPGMVSLPPPLSPHLEMKVKFWSVKFRPLEFGACLTVTVTPPARHSVTPSPFGPQNRFGLLVSVGTSSWRNL